MEDQLKITDKQIVLAYQVCRPCGLIYGHQPRGGVSTYWKDTCDICGAKTEVTEFRDFGYARQEFYSSFTRCTDCDGKGYYILGEVCDKCKGVGYIV